jgi:hypothetical protein
MGLARIPFEAMDEQRISSAARWGLITAITSIVSIVMSTAVAVPRYLDIVGGSSMGAVTMMPLAVVGLTFVATVLLDVWLIQASLAFRKVALTDVADQHYLLSGFSKLRNYFMALGILFILAGLFVAVAMFLGMAGASAAF